MNGKSELQWLDFSGAPPMLIPQRLAKYWRATTDRTTGEYRDLDLNHLVTDYDRACAVSWPGKSTLEFMGAEVLVLYTEYDQHTWDARRQMVACSGWWLPSDEELRKAKWSNPIQWRAEETDYLLMNSALDGTVECFDELLGEEWMPVRLKSGMYTIEYADVTTHGGIGCFHRFTMEGRSR